MTGAFHPASPVIAGTAEDMAVILSPRLGFADIGELARDIDEGFLRHSRDTLTTVPGTHSVLGALASVGLPLGLATNDGEANAQAHLDAAGMAGYFGFVAGHDSGHGAKPGPGMVRAFARLVGVEAGAVAMVGDTETDIQAARSAGAIAIVVTREAERIGADLDALVASADHAIATLEDLPDLLGLTR